MSGGLTKKQRDLLAFIQAYVAQNDGVSPTFDEMMAAVDQRSKAGIHRLLCGLEERGFIRRTPNRARCIFLPDDKVSEFERGRRAGYAEGYAAGLTARGLQHAEAA